MRKLKACGVLVVRGNPIDQFLLMLHSNRLDLPKGHLEEGETEVECALRELAEETSITEQDLRLDPDFRFTTRYIVRPKKYGGAPCEKTVVIFLAHLARDVNIVTTEHEGFRWFPWNPPHRLQKETIDPLLAELEKWLA